jgi:hypothetical protein
MRIVKDVLGILEIDPVSGKIWLNSPECILRASNLKFLNIEEKYSRIDITGNNVIMFPREDHIKDEDLFIKNYIEILCEKINMDSQDKNKTLLIIDEIVQKIKHKIIGDNK